ncbi:MAG: phenylalanine--tRNA ligase subunit beta [Jatrophihabitantaceae bacterium]
MAWLADQVELPEGLTAQQLGEAFIRVGLEVENVSASADALTGPILVGRVLSFDAEPQKNGKTIRWCQIDVGEAQPRGIVCGASNFAVGDLIAASLPGAVLPGGFAIAARKTYGHVSDGMICSVRELGIGDDHSGGLPVSAGAAGGGGILVLPPDSATPGDDVLNVLGLRDAVLEIAVTPDRGYCLSMRGLAREAASALGTSFHDVADSVRVLEDDASVWDVRIDDITGCDRFSMRAVTGLDPAATTPEWLRARLRQAGMRPISLAVDVTNYVMMETGQPLHAYDCARLAGPIVVRRARPGEKLTTLDNAVRTLHTNDLLITDDSGPIGLAGVMGGASTEIGASTSAVLLEAAHFSPTAIARAVRRHRLPSEAAKRFERGVDPQIAGVALQRCVDLLVEHGGATATGGRTVVGDGPAPVTITLPASRPEALVGMPIDRGTVVARLIEVGCRVDGVDILQVRPPSWRPDLTDPADLVEEVARLEGYDKIPSQLPIAPPGGGLNEEQKRRRAVSRALAADGCTEVLSPPFVAASMHEVFGLAADDPRRAAARLANPLSEAEPELRTSLLPGLLTTLQRNVGRGAHDLALFEMGLVFLPRTSTSRAPRPGVDQRPTDAQLEAMNAAIPVQPRHVAAVFCGDLERKGWWGPARAATWSDAIHAARVIARAARTGFDIRPVNYPPWHPGRCAELLLDGQIIGHAGELHPRVLVALGLPERTCAMELNLDLVPPPGPALTPTISGYPPVLLDVALVVGQDVGAAAVEHALRAGAGDLLESVQLFDVYANAERIGTGMKSLAFALRFRAPDRTLTVEQATVSRDSAVESAAQALGAQLRS